MGKLLWAERQKLRRSRIVWTAIFATILIAVIVFIGGEDSSYETQFIDNAGWYLSVIQIWATVLALPAVIALLGSYMICREEQQDTLKSLRLIPINEAKLTIAKMIITFFFSIFLYLLLFAVAFLVECVLHFYALTPGMILDYLKAFLLDGVFVFFAISPIIAIVSLMKKGPWIALIIAELYSIGDMFSSMSNTLKAAYPIGAVFTLSGYYQPSVRQIILSIISLTLCLGISAAILIYMNKTSVIHKC